MRADLQEIIITSKQLYTLIGFEHDKAFGVPRYSILIDFKKRFIFFIPMIAILGVFIVFFAANLLSPLANYIIVYLHIDNNNLTFSLYIIIISTIYFIVTWIILSKAAFKKITLSKLLEEVYKHNGLIENLNVLDQLEAAGNPINLNNRHNVIKALNLTRKDLIRALETERILRDNPKFNSQEFYLDLNALEALKVSEKASEYGRILDEAIQIEVNVQKEMRKLNNGH
ncbi:hypothetical protein H6G36_04960 [Anabaena minutissima FACHB-250]|nr:hypothetical protein [Anabaena minutissima FACHB-250]